MIQCLVHSLKVPANFLTHLKIYPRTFYPIQSLSISLFTSAFSLFRVGSPNHKSPRSSVLDSCLFVVLFPHVFFHSCSPSGVQSSTSSLIFLDVKDFPHNVIVISSFSLSLSAQFSVLTIFFQDPLIFQKPTILHLHSSNPRKAPFCGFTTSKKPPTKIVPKKNLNPPQKKPIKNLLFSTQIRKKGTKKQKRI